MMNFDHAVVNVLGEMDSVAESYRRLGFQLTPRGHHTLGSINHLAVFGETYVELLGYAEGEREKRAELWEHPPGLTGIAFRAGDAAALHRQMAEKGVPIEPFKDFSRPVEIDGTRYEAAFRTFQIDRAELANGRLFFCQHNTPELIWRPEYMDHPNGVSEITEAIVACDAPAALADLVTAAEGLARRGDDSVDAGTTVVRFLPRAAVAEDFGPVPDDKAGHMRMVALGLRCRSLDALRALLDGNAVPYEPATGSVVTVSPTEAHGLYLRFSEA
ncbi:VOC family protein [Allosediminivita pacifica]|uniref:Glyoxalase-like protein n=1 Tax=Allosediminivita pacifica TaxID=1267769 RepID=A0A2T6AX41_9RHOB|nr:VOC family protein [Allosediminivita pacifica]PTX48366.1 glyoxalase-like protein [Allosediminivita pacifica]GGB11024.1 hypothetical protein GCM10011324_21430 [Allosediminivita pacifica]